MHARQEASLWELLAGMFDFLPGTTLSTSRFLPSAAPLSRRVSDFLAKRYDGFIGLVRGPLWPA